MSMILSNQRDFFDIPPGITYLNCANMSPLLNTVRRAGIDGMQQRNTPWKIRTTDWFDPSEELRSLFSRLINAGKENIALIPSVSYGIAVAANNIQLTAQQSILLLDREYPSNVYAWRELAKKTGAQIITVEKEPGLSWTEAIIANIKSTTAVVAIPHCHWTDGSFIDLESVSKATKRVNAKLVIDASQVTGAYPIDVNKIKPDFLLTVGYKWLLGPYGLAYLYADSQYAETGKPIEFSWLNKKGSEDFSRLVDYVDEYKPGARRFDAGGFPNFVNIPMAIAGLIQLLDWGVENIQETLAVLTAETELKARALGLNVPHERVGHMIGVRIAEDTLSALNKKLVDNHVYISVRGNNIRIAPHLFNEKTDIDRLFELLESK